MTQTPQDTFFSSEDPVHLKTWRLDMFWFVYKKVKFFNEESSKYKEVDV